MNRSTLWNFIFCISAGLSLSACSLEYSIEDLNETIEEIVDPKPTYVRTTPSDNSVPRSTVGASGSGKYKVTAQFGEESPEKKTSSGKYKVIFR